MTFQKTWSALGVVAPVNEVRFVDLVVRDNANSNQYASGVGVLTGMANRVYIVGSTFLNNTGLTSAHQIFLGSTTATVANTAVWSTNPSGTMLGKAANTTLTTNNSFVVGQTLSGTGNLAGTIDPKLRSDLTHLLPDSPLRGAGGSLPQSRIDIDGELRPSTAPDIGVDQFVDSDGDGLEDLWETTVAGDLTTLTSQTQDADGDGLSNAEEFAAFSNPVVADTDGDGVSDGDEVHTYGTNPTATDSDADDMPDGWEVAHGLAAVVPNGFEDADGDRYPNVFEYAGSTDPSDGASMPTATYTVDAAGTGTHTTLGAAVDAANVANGAYQIIGIAPGTYTGAVNSNITIASTKPKLLFIGLEGAAKTIIDGGLANWGWQIQNSIVVSSLTFQKTWSALGVVAPVKEVRFVDLVVRDNANSNQYASGVGVLTGMADRVYIVGSTFLNNTGLTSANQIFLGSTTATVANTVVWSTNPSGTMLGKAANTTLTTNNSFVVGQTLTGTGNLAGTIDPKLRSDLTHLLSDSPLRSAGGPLAQSRVDIDGELRPTTTPDIGVDQFVDSDDDGLADTWELSQTGNLTTLTSSTQDADGDGLSNDAEYAVFTNPTVADTDGDGLSDGAEVNQYGTSPRVADTDGDDMPDAWEVAHGLVATVANAFEDADGDRYPNVFEYAGATDPSDRASIPTPTYLVDAAGGGTHTTISAAMNAADVANGAYQIIGIAPGTYTGGPNLRDVWVAATKPKLLFIGLEGAAKTIIDGESVNFGWVLNNAAVISSLTIQKTRLGIWIDAPSKEVRLVDLLVRDNAKYYWDSAGLQVHSASNVYIVGSTFVDNAGRSDGEQILVEAGTTTMLNTVVWGQSTGTLVGKSYGTLVTNYCLVKGQTLTGTGNLAGTVDPKLRSDTHLLWDSPLREAGGAVAQSQIDLDGELRPSTAPDIGVDQFVDSDGDGLADKWELDEAGDLTTLTGRSQDADGDGLTNDAEYAAYAKPLVADTDGDGLSDGDEVNLYGTSPLVTDTDGDDMPDAWEVGHGLVATVANAFEDADGDRYPNVFEYAGATDPSDRASIPTPTYLVDAAGGGTHTTISAAMNAADVANGAYQIIGIAPGTYTGGPNLRDVWVAATKPKLLFIGLEGAAKTIIDGETLNFGWVLNNAAVISSLTIQKTRLAIWIDAPSKEVRLVDLLVRDNAKYYWDSAGVQVHSASNVYIVGSTFNDNAGRSDGEQILVEAGTTTMLNTVVWGQSTGTLVGKSYGTLVTNYCLVKGQTLTGTGNLAGTVDPMLRSNDRPRAGSPLRGAGGPVAQSLIDMDGELRPINTPDIGVDQFNDSDTDGLPDSWEIVTAGNTNAIAGGADDDNDELSNAAEYDLETNWLDSDTDNDGVKDGVEVALATNPFVADADDLAGDLNGDGLIDSIGAQLGYQPDQVDDDGDGVSNSDEAALCTNIVRSDSDGDGVPDNTDAFPLDPLMSALPSDPQDVTAPTITLTDPWYAVEQ